jgi:hypothetical protein
VIKPDFAAALVFQGLVKLLEDLLQLIGIFRFHCGSTQLSPVLALSSFGHSESPPMSFL